MCRGWCRPSARCCAIRRGWMRWALRAGPTWKRTTPGPRSQRAISTCCARSSRLQSRLDEREGRFAVEERRHDVARVHDQLRVLVDGLVLELLVRGREHERVELAQRLGVERHRLQVHVAVLARVLRHLEE